MQKVYSDSRGHCWEFYFNDFVTLDEIRNYLNDLFSSDSDFPVNFNEPHTCFASKTGTGNIIISGDEDYVFVNVTKIQPIF